MIDYPGQLSLEAVQKVIEIIKNREMDTRKVEFAHAAWNVSGFLLKTFLGGDAERFGCDGGCCNKTEMEALEYMGSVLEEMQNEGSFGAEDEKAGFDISILLTLLPLIMELLEALGIFKKKDKEDASN